MLRVAGTGLVVGTFSPPPRLFLRGSYHPSSYYSAHSSLFLATSRVSCLLPRFIRYRVLPLFYSLMHGIGKDGGNGIVEDGWV